MPSSLYRATPFAAARLSVLRVIALFALAGLALTARAMDLPSAVMVALRGATFEVVVQKPTKDALTYEKELPFDLLPFRQRNDKYESIGTAFALDNGQFVSAAHVVNLASPSTRDRIYLRDSDGRVIPLDKVLKYSLARDFIVFTVKDYRAARTLKVAAAAKTNAKVYSVGNALGDGIVVRDGLYTSDTPEEDDGRWKWLRFSAAASPGNSGGPLIDGQGRVLGVVLRKSANENLNFALPMGEVMKAPSDKGELHERALFGLAITDRTMQSKLDESISLPQDYVKFGQALEVRFNGFSKSMADQFNATYRQDMFPAASGAQWLLYDTGTKAAFPHLLAKQRDGRWDAIMPEETRRAEIGKNGWLTFGSVSKFMLARMQVPDDVPLAGLRSDSKQFMDLILRGVYYARSFDSENVRITSLGPAIEEEIYVDAYERKWQVRRWVIDFNDEEIVSYALPTPDGYVMMLNAAPRAASYMYELDLKTLTDYVFITYYGTLKQWQPFLAEKTLLPAALLSVSVEPRYGKEFRYQNDRVAIRYTDDAMKVTEDSDLQLLMSYFKSGDRVRWGVTSVIVGENKDTSTSLQFGMHPQPPKSLPDADRHVWESLVKGRMPFTGTAVFDRSQTYIMSPMLPDGAKGEAAAAPMLYSVGYSEEGSQDGTAMQKKLARLRQGVQIRER